MPSIEIKIDRANNIGYFDNLQLIYLSKVSVALARGQNNCSWSVCNFALTEKLITYVVVICVLESWKKFCTDVKYELATYIFLCYFSKSEAKVVLHSKLDTFIQWQDLNYLLFICKNKLILDSRDPLLLLFVMAKWPLWQAVCGSLGSMAAAMLSVIPMAKAV